jgi:predicted Zn-dependent protease
LELDKENPQYLRHLAQLHADAGQLDEAEAIFSGMVARIPEEAHVQVGYARILERSGKLTKAAAVAREAATIDPQYAAFCRHLNSLVDRQMRPFADHPAQPPRPS